MQVIQYNLIEIKATEYIINKIKSFISQKEVDSENPIYPEDKVILAELYRLLPFTRPETNRRISLDTKIYEYEGTFFVLKKIKKEKEEQYIFFVVPSAKYYQKIIITKTGVE